MALLMGQVGEGCLKPKRVPIPESACDDGTLRLQDRPGEMVGEDDLRRLE